MNLQLSPADGAGVDHGHRARRRCSTSPRLRWGATSTRGRRRSCRSTGATGWRSRRWRRACAPTPPTSGRPPASGMGNREFQLNIDGQEVSVAQGGNRGQPRFSRDAIGEFQFLSSRFDATQGRSTGLQVNAITKSGTNVSAGSFSGYFRDDNFNAADFLAGTVLPYSNQQLSTHLRRTDPPGPAPLLRQLRVRARAADADLQHAVSAASTSSSRARAGRTWPALRFDYQFSPRIAPDDARATCSTTGTRTRRSRPGSRSAVIRRARRASSGTARRSLPR